MNPTGWRAAVNYDGRFLTFRLHLFRRDADGQGEVIVGFDDQGWPKTERLDAGAMTVFPGFSLFDDLAQAIAEAVEPGPSKAELHAYKDALDIERRRVDEILQRVTPPA